MPKLITGFLLGVFTTLAAFYWFDDRPPVAQSSPTQQSSSAGAGAEIPRADPAKTTDPVAEAGSETSRMSMPVESAPKPETSNLQSQSSQAQSIAAPQLDPGATSPQRTSSRALPNGDYPPEIADMIENNVNKELQARYEADKREESWAIYMEGQLAAYFAQKPALAQFYFSLTDCRTSICSVHALGYGPDALTLWNSATADLVSQPWFDFNSMSMNRRNPEPDVLGIVLILTKKPPDQ